MEPKLWCHNMRVVQSFLSKGCPFKRNIKVSFKRQLHYRSKDSQNMPNVSTPQMLFNGNEKVTREFIRIKESDVKSTQEANNEMTVCTSNQILNDTNDENSVLNKIIENNTTNGDKLMQQIKEIESYILRINNRMNDSDMFEMPIRLSHKPVFRQLTDHKSFNDLESRRMSELFLSSNVFKYKSFHTKNIIELTNIVDINCSCNKMLNRDLALIKYGCLEILVLRSSILYDINTDYWTMAYNSDDQRVDSFKLVALNYLTKIVSEWNRDYIILDLLTAIILFNPNRPNLTHRDVVKAEQQLYIYLLQRYLHLKHGSEFETQIKLSILMKLMSDLEYLCLLKKKNGGDFYLDSFGPILQEILYDIINT
ncbi:unnamed protein product [Medioppia subpectinata]|uniref:NR LBD domain-containing protein n=1 Tax=Medioppia subpectinata TaxID=1979941 RepID=A0A7R9KIX9_9ACAR|nr:unnamed protein product [Medioppia subpectinata]CAG2103174.1 unnamed protein product [Medioppia subpectinata]